MKEVVTLDRFWNWIKNEEGNPELRIDGEIVSDDDAWLYEWFGIPTATPNAFRTELANYKGQDITVWIDSWGGDVFAAAGIYNALKEHRGKVTVKIDGKAVSAASVISMAGDEVLMSPVSIMMIHNPWTTAVGEAKDMRHAADILDEVKQSIINAYQAKTSLDRNEISQMMDREEWMSAQKAISFGFADGVLYDQTDSNSVQNAFSISRLAIQNSANLAMRKFFDQYRKINQNNVTTEEPFDQRLFNLRRKRLDLLEKI